MRNLDNDHHSADAWFYWRDKYGAVDALEYYPRTVAASPVLQAAIAQVAIAKAAIEHIMANLDDTE